MKHAGFCLLLVFLFLSTAVANEDYIQVVPDSVFGEKIVLCEIAFLPNSYTLTQRAEIALAGVAKQLQTIDTEARTIRIEGFSCDQDTVSDPTTLSMNRALAVENYLRISHAVSFERFLTGHSTVNSVCNVQIALYNNPWQTVTPPLQVSNRNNLDGPS